MNPVLVLPIAIFLILAILFLLFLRRAGRLLAATRDVERFRRQVSDLSGRVEVSLAEICSRVDALRRGQLDSTAVAGDLTASLEAVDRYADEGRALRPPRSAAAIRDGIVAELERAKRALEMVEHGVGIQVSARAGSRELEAQTAIKRGYLNVLHAREAIGRHAADAAQIVPLDPTRNGAARRSA